MTDLDLVVTGRRVLTPAGEVSGWVAVRHGRIAAVESLASGGDIPSAAVRVDLADDEVLLPGLVDTHVHVNEPGRADWEGFATATLAAAAGGVTTIVDMPLNSIPATVDVAALAVKKRAAAGQCYVDVGFWGGAVPGNVGALRPLHDAGVFGFKCFLADSGVAEFPPLDSATLRTALHEVAAFGGRMLVHAEDPTVLAATSSNRDPRSYQTFLATRPPSAEDAAVAELIVLATETGARVHVVHLSSASALGPLAEARRTGIPISAETCPHYLSLCAENVQDGATQYKCCPPIRTAANQDELWRGLAEGVIDLVVTDHSPCPPALKGLDTGDFETAWGGIASLQLGLPIVWTAAQARGHNLSDVARWMAAGPAELAGLRQKGRLSAGADADFSVFAPEDDLVVDPARLYHRHRITPYEGMRLRGVVRRTFVRGTEVALGEPHGGLLARVT